MRWGAARGDCNSVLLGLCPLTCFLGSLSQIAVQNCKSPRSQSGGRGHRVLRAAAGPALDWFPARSSFLHVSSPAVGGQSGAEQIDRQILLPPRNGCLMCFVCECSRCSLGHGLGVGCFVVRSCAAGSVPCKWSLAFPMRWKWQWDGLDCSRPRNTKRPHEWHCTKGRNKR